MELNVKLNNSYGRLTSREPFLITSTNEDRYYLNLDSDLKIKNLVAIFRRGNNSTERKYFEPIGEVKQIEIPADFVAEGELECELKVLSHGIPVAIYHVEPIIFAKVDTEFKGSPEFDELKALVEKQTALIEAQNDIIIGLTQRLDVAEQKVNEIWANEEM